MNMIETIQSIRVRLALYQRTCEPKKLNGAARSFPSG